MSHAKTSSAPQMNNPQQVIALLSNPASGNGKALRIQEWLCHNLNQRSLSYTLYTPPWPSSLEKFSAVWLVGGDGTIFHFINQYPNLQLPVALFGGGNGNDFAWQLLGEISLEESLERALAGKSIMVDAGYCNGNYFLNGIGIGFDGSVVKSMDRKRTILRGHAAYLYTVIKQIFFYREQEIDVFFADGLHQHASYLMIAAANGSRYGGGFLVAPQARIDDRLLDFIFIKKISVLKRLLNLHKIEQGKHLDLPFVYSIQGGKIVIRSNHLLDAHLDGEYLADTSFDIEVRPAKFKFIY
jgi:YegS/Rv2252/BmrU family lipid kinase